MSPNQPRDRLIAETLRLHERYLKEVVERFSVCPWAKPARLEGRLRAHVVLGRQVDIPTLRPVLEQWGLDPNAHVGFIIAPRFEGDAPAFSAWATSIEELTGGAFFAAPFFPNASNAQGMVHFLRQTPNPTVQLVKRTVLEPVRAQDPPHYADIFALTLTDLEAPEPPRKASDAVLAHNQQTVEREGRKKLQAIIDDIRRDRDESYGRKRGLSPI